MVQATALLTWPPQTTEHVGSDELSEREVIRLCRTGRTEAFTALVRKYQDRIYNTIYRMCRSREDAEELTQEAFLRAFKYIDRFNGSCRFYTWLFKIAINNTRSFLRRGMTVKFVPLAGQDNEWQGGSEGNFELPDNGAERPGKKVEGREVMNRIEKAISELDSKIRAVVILRDIEDMKYHEISDVLGIPHGTVKSRLHWGRTQLKEKLSDLVS